MSTIDETKYELEYLTENCSDPELIKKRLSFYEAISDLAALYVDPKRFAEYSTERSNALSLLGKKEESKKYELIAENIYRILRE